MKYRKKPVVIEARQLHHEDDDPRCSDCGNRESSGQHGLGCTEPTEREGE